MKHIYIPLCLYFNRQQNGKLHKYIQIYIPLCLYFNDALPETAHLVDLFTFHYVSILICDLQDCFGHFFMIYIPLCLYFNCLQTL